MPESLTLTIGDIQDLECIRDEAERKEYRHLEQLVADSVRSACELTTLLNTIGYARRAWKVSK